MGGVHAPGPAPAVSVASIAARVVGAKPLAVSLSPTRFTDPETVAKWFARNCRGVLGRACTAQEKGDVLTYFISQ